jgi:hypothetical protein
MFGRGSARQDENGYGRHRYADLIDQDSPENKRKSRMN